MKSLAVLLFELDDDELERFIEIWVERKGRGYHRVERVGKANDKGRDVVAFLTPQKHEGPWHLYQCKRKTRGSKLGTTEGLAELAKVFYHHSESVYATLPTSYVFVSPRGIVGPFMDLINNPSKLQATLLNEWDARCADAITSENVPLTASLRNSIEAYDFSQVSQLTAPTLVKDEAARPALVAVLGVEPGDAPAGVVPDEILDEELPYVGQLRQVYEEATEETFGGIESVLAHHSHGGHFRDQRTRFFDARAFNVFHRDNTNKEALVAFHDDVYHGVIEVYRETHATRLERVNAVLKHAAILPAALISKTVRITVKQGMCHCFANEGRLPWIP